MYLVSVQNLHMYGRYIYIFPLNITDIQRPLL